MKSHAPDFPAGEYQPPRTFTRSQIHGWLAQLESAPARAVRCVAGLSDSQLDTRYRNWTIRQIIHHLADSHINCYVRFKWALTEETPTIKSYDETQWSELVDAKTVPIDCSLTILEGVHARWCQLVGRLNDQQLKRGYFHPEMDRVVTLAEALPSYVWHVDHHLAQIQWLRERHQWT